MITTAVRVFTHVFTQVWQMRSNLLSMTVCGWFTNGVQTAHLAKMGSLQSCNHLQNPTCVHIIENLESKLTMQSWHSLPHSMCQESSRESFLKWVLWELYVIVCLKKISLSKAPFGSSFQEANWTQQGICSLQNFPGPARGICTYLIRDISRIVKGLQQSLAPGGEQWSGALWGEWSVWPNLINIERSLKE